MTISVSSAQFWLGFGLSLSFDNCIFGRQNGHSNHCRTHEYAIHDMHIALFNIVESINMMSKHILYDGNSLYGGHSCYINDDWNDR